MEFSQTITSLRLTQPLLGTRKALGSKDGRRDVDHITHRVSTINEKYGSNTVLPNIPQGMKMVRKKLAKCCFLLLFFSDPEALELKALRLGVMDIVTLRFGATNTASLGNLWLFYQSAELNPHAQRTCYP